MSCSTPRAKRDMVQRLRAYIPQETVHSPGERPCLLGTNGARTIDGQLMMWRLMFHSVLHPGGDASAAPARERPPGTATDLATHKSGGRADARASARRSFQGALALRPRRLRLASYLSRSVAPVGGGPTRKRQILERHDTPSNASTELSGRRGGHHQRLGRWLGETSAWRRAEPWVKPTPHGWTTSEAPMGPACPW